ncbi:MAG TPA: DUF5946 family protein [Candidatus Limnocylindrales bacterium]
MADPPASIACPQCGALVPDTDGPRHVYVPSAPGCWAAFGAVRADEMLRFPGSSQNNLTVDTYMAQHPGDGTDRRDRQSVFVHLTSLCAVLERAATPARSPEVLRAVLASRTEYPALLRTRGPGTLTVLDVAGAGDEADHDRRARAWAASVWESWRDHHVTVRAALDAAKVRP